METQQLGNSIVLLRQAAIDYPYNFTFRSAAALKLGNGAVGSKLEAWQIAANPELREALDSDPYAPDLLALMILNDMALNDYRNAQVYFDRFKLVAKKSYLIEYIKNQRKD
jgi:hypothetical protein